MEVLEENWSVLFLKSGIPLTLELTQKIGDSRDPIAIFWKYRNPRYAWISGGSQEEALIERNRERLFFSGWRERRKEHEIGFRDSTFPQTNAEADFPGHGHGFAITKK